MHAFWPNLSLPSVQEMRNLLVDAMLSEITYIHLWPVSIYPRLLRKFVASYQTLDLEYNTSITLDQHFKVSLLPCPKGELRNACIYRCQFVWLYYNLVESFRMLLLVAVYYAEDNLKSLNWNIPTVTALKEHQQMCFTSILYASSMYCIDATFSAYTQRRNN